MMNGLGRLRILASRPLLQNWASCGSESRCYVAVKPKNVAFKAKTHNTKTSKVKVPATHATTTASPGRFDDPKEFSRKAKKLLIHEILRLRVLDYEPDYADRAQQFLSSNPTTTERDLLSGCESKEDALRLAVVCAASPEKTSLLHKNPDLSTQLRLSLSGMEVSLMSEKELLILLPLAIVVQPLPTALDCKAARHLLAATLDREKARSLSEGELTTLIWLWRFLLETSKLDIQLDKTLVKEGLDLSTLWRLCLALWRDIIRWERFSLRTKYQILYAGSWRGLKTEQANLHSRTDPLDTAPYLNYLYDSLASGGAVEIISACKLLFSMDLPRLDVKQKSELVKALRSWLLNAPNNIHIRAVARVIAILNVIEVQGIKILGEHVMGLDFWDGILEKLPDGSYEARAKDFLPIIRFLHACNYDPVQMNPDKTTDILRRTFDESDTKGSALYKEDGLKLLAALCAVNTRGVFQIIGKDAGLYRQITALLQPLFEGKKDTSDLSGTGLWALYELTWRREFWRHWWPSENTLRLSPERARSLTKKIRWPMSEQSKDPQFRLLSSHKESLAAQDKENLQWSIIRPFPHHDFLAKP